MVNKTISRNIHKLNSCITIVFFLSFKIIAIIYQKDFAPIFTLIKGLSSFIFNLIMTKSNLQGWNKQYIMQFLDWYVHAYKLVFVANCLPWVPEKGTVGASGDLAPLSHLALGMMGEGKMWSPKSGWADAKYVRERNINYFLKLFNLLIVYKNEKPPVDSNNMKHFLAVSNKPNSCFSL